MKLKNKVSTSDRGNSLPIKGGRLNLFQNQLGNGWRVVNEHHLEKNWEFDNFKFALDFTTRVGSLAEEQRHHPDIFLAWGKVRIKLWTHTINGLSESDFSLAAKIDRLLPHPPQKRKNNL